MVALRVVTTPVLFLFLEVNSFYTGADVGLNLMRERLLEQVAAMQEALSLYFGEVIKALLVATELLAEIAFLKTRSFLNSVMIIMRDLRANHK